MLPIDCRHMYCQSASLDMSSIIFMLINDPRKWSSIHDILTRCVFPKISETSLEMLSLRKFIYFKWPITWRAYWTTWSSLINIKIVNDVFVIIMIYIRTLSSCSLRKTFWVLDGNRTRNLLIAGETLLPLSYKDSGGERRLNLFTGSLNLCTCSRIENNLRACVYRT